MTQGGKNSRSSFENIDERLGNCSSWVRQAFARLDRACRRMAPDAQTKDAAAGMGRMFYGGPKQRLFCRIDPKQNWLGVQFNKSIRGLVKARGMLRTGRQETWIDVRADTDLGAVESLIEQSLDSVRTA